MVTWLDPREVRAFESASVMDRSYGRSELHEPLGMVTRAVASRRFEHIVLLFTPQVGSEDRFISWLKTRTTATVAAYNCQLEDISDHEGIYIAAENVLTKLKEESVEPLNFSFYLSAGTKAMHAVWLLIGKTKFRGEFIQWSPQAGVVTAKIPFDISLDFVPSVFHKPDQRISDLTKGFHPPGPEFDEIVHRCEAMQRVIALARTVAPREVAVLIQGESGTGKELFARAIHKSSPRRDEVFRPVNCGAIPKELVESELFGHEKGAFSGAEETHPGVFEQAEGGTVFLDEVGELPLHAQVKLLRVIDNDVVYRLKATKPTKINVRIIAATNRNLAEEIRDRNFRLDLFYRLAVGVLTIPPIRERAGDIGLLLDWALDSVNRKLESMTREPEVSLSYTSKVLSVPARNLAKSHPWPGNVRELQNTIMRAALFNGGRSRIELADFQEALILIEDVQSDSVLGRPFGADFSLGQIIEEAERHYIERAMKESAGKIGVAAELLGMANYQSLTTRLKKYGLEG